MTPGSITDPAERNGDPLNGNTGANQLMGKQDRRPKVVEREPRRQHHQVRRLGDRLGALHGMGRGIEDQQIRLARPRQHLPGSTRGRDGDRWQPSGFGAPGRPFGAGDLCGVEIGNRDPPAALCKLSGHQSGERALADPTLLRH